MSVQRGVYSCGEDIKINIQYKDVMARKMGMIKSRLNKYVYFNLKENKGRHSTKKLIKEVSGESLYYILCMCIYVYMYLYMYMYLYIYIYLNFVVLRTTTLLQLF